MTLIEQELLAIGRNTIRSEAEALNIMEQSLGEEFVRAVEAILRCHGKLIVTGMGKNLRKRSDYGR